MITVYGIPNCDTVRKARKWLGTHKIDFIFFDLRKDGLTNDIVKSWVSQLGWEKLVNKRSATWKKIPQKLRDTITNDNVSKLIMEYPTLVKRPVIDNDGKYIVGFDEKIYRQLVA